MRLGDLGKREGLRNPEREAPGLDQLADLSERMDCAAGVPAAERHPVLLGAPEVRASANAYRSLSRAREAIRRR
jgi:hypothetical protein